MKLFAVAVAVALVLLFSPTTRAPPAARRALRAPTEEIVEVSRNDIL